jgi:effector-binding domain-containing protein
MRFLKLTLCLTVLALFWTKNTMAIEEAKYTVVLKEKSFEIREYEPHIVAQTLVDGDFDNAGNKAFKRLFKYISGNNKSQQEIAMTAPVTQSTDSEKIAMTSPVGQQQIGDNWAVSFMMPAAYSLETLPQPKDPKISLRQVPARHIASIRYSGFWNEKGFLSNLEKLETWIGENDLDITGAPTWARYNSPFTPWFMRRNEILLPIAPPLAD